MKRRHHAQPLAEVGIHRTLECLWLSLLHHIAGFSVWTDSSLDEQLAVVCELAGNLLPVGVKHPDRRFARTYPRRTGGVCSPVAYPAAPWPVRQAPIRHHVPRSLQLPSPMWPILIKKSWSGLRRTVCDYMRPSYTRFSLFLVYLQDKTETAHYYILA